MEEKKYILTDETIEHKGHVLHRIKAVRDFCNVKSGQFGGYIESEENLSHDGNCWVYDKAKVYEKAKVIGKSRILDAAEIFENAVITDDASVFDRSKIHGYAIISGMAAVNGTANICGDSRVRDHACVDYNAEVFGFSIIQYNMKLKRNARISGKSDVLYVGPIGSRNTFTTFYKASENDIWVSCGCFNGSIENFEGEVIKTHGNNRFGTQYLELIPYVRKLLGGNEI